MGLFKKAKTWHYDFYFQKTRYQGSTKCTNHEKAKTWLTAFRHNLALTGVGLVQKQVPPVLSVFLQGTFLASIRQNITKPATLRFYKERIDVLCRYIPFTELSLDQIDELAVQTYKETRLKARMAIASINAELRVLRKAMLFADTCGLIRYKRIRSLPGEKGRDFVLTGEMEKAYLAVAPYPLKQAAILMLDLGLRPSECVALRKDHASPESVTVCQGKTINARRVLPQTERTREVFEFCAAVHPDSPWVFPGLKGQHYARVSLNRLHSDLRRKYSFPAALILYSFRHTFATRLAESGAQAWEIMKLMGHASVRISERYIHPSADYLGLAMRRKEAYDRLMRGEESSAVTAKSTTIGSKIR